MDRNFTSITKQYDTTNNEITFVCYKAIENGIEYFVPLDEANTDYQAIQEWISAGNTVIDNPPE